MLSLIHDVICWDIPIGKRDTLSDILKLCQSALAEGIHSCRIINNDQKFQKKMEEDKTLQLFSKKKKVVDHLHDNINHHSRGYQYDDDIDDLDDDVDDNGHSDDDHRHAPVDVL